MIVVNCDRRELLRACLGSLARQRGVEFEVIVVDNGSSDGSREMVSEEYGTAARLHARLIVNGEDRNVARAVENVSAAVETFGTTEPCYWRAVPASACIR